MYEKVVLSNGLRVILVPFQESRSTTIRVYFGVGSRYEQDDEQGISHFLEHLMSTGTERRPTRRVIAEEADLLGGEMNAGTSKHYTVYYTKVAHDHFARGVDLLADMLQNSRFPDDEIVKEKGIITEEINMYYDMPHSHVHDLFDQLIWGDTPLGRDILGTTDSINAFTRDDFVRYMGELYTIDSMVIGVGGRFDREEVVAELERQFTNFPGMRERALPINEQKQQKPQMVMEHRKTEQAHLVLGFRGFSHVDPERYPLLVLDTILGGNMSSRLFIRIREELGLAYAIGSSTTHYTDVGALTIFAGLRVKEVEQAIRTILEEVKLFGAEPVSERELDAAKEYLRGRMALSLDDPEGVTSWIAKQELLLGKVRGLDDILADIDAVTREDVHRVAQTIFTPAGLNLALIGPFRGKRAFEQLLEF